MSRAKAERRAPTAEDLYRLLTERYALPEWALFRQVCEAGTGGRRYADAVAMNLFPSRGMEVHGFEIKVSRGDWLREVRDPAKADELARFCDRWWIVAGGPEVVGIGELPPTWGLILLRGDTLAQKVAAPKLSPEPLSRGFIATMFRRARDDGRLSWESQLRQAVEDAKREAREKLTAEHEEEIAEERKAREAFEAAAGVKLETYRWNPEQVGSAVRLVLEGQGATERIRCDLERLRRNAREVLADLDEMLDGPKAASGEEAA